MIPNPNYNSYLFLFCSDRLVLSHTHLCNIGGGRPHREVKWFLGNPGGVVVRKGKIRVLGRGVNIIHYIGTYLLPGTCWSVVTERVLKLGNWFSKLNRTRSDHLLSEFWLLIPRRWRRTVQPTLHLYIFISHTSHLTSSLSLCSYLLPLSY